MTKKTKKQLFAALTALIICICTLSPLAALASNDYLAYSFKIAAHQQWTHWHRDELRSTKNTKNAWKVNMIGSDEPTSAHPDGKGLTATTYRLSRYDNHSTAASGMYNVKEYSGAHYYPANSKGSGTCVLLSGRDNNNIAKTYGVTGVWDEETGKILS